MRKRIIAAAVVATALIATGVGVAAASVPDASGIIHGCYGNSGNLRIVDTEEGQACNQHSETSLDWSQIGPQGPQGPAGASPGIYEVADSMVLAGADPSTGINSQSGGMVASCAPGDSATGGGFLADKGADPKTYVIKWSVPSLDSTGRPDAWLLAAVNYSERPLRLADYVLCMHVSN